ncbi:AAA family ATPase [Acinetobacter haemolyticus]|nr:AAA family ATPase [Acinetobacter haemolyticus]NAR61762.1 AAA family ATPase [Acinetobacter haemolyticus]NAR66424.1 AAA family ATPase [Acinetobacter haemolyticus]NAR82396.1 AAA family ATPase [Acinetobacter haemolyticus]NAR93944.1 AAA family ATPase [Acinetobacter haemolyticus]
MTEKLYYWAENLDGYSSDNEQDYDQIIEIKRLNFFIGKNNAGKSRFLRELFKNKNGQQLYNSLQFRKLMAFKQKLTSSQEYPHNNNYNHFLTTVAQLNPTNISSSKNLFSQALEYLSRFNQLQCLYPNNNKPMALDLFSKEIEQNLNPIFTNFKFYIPILRGMRPVTDQENKQPYIERAQKDYFSDTTKFNSKNIITGECLYHELKIHLLGEPEQRDLIKNYEKKLSQYFFDNEPVSLIPKHDQDVVNIKIGKDQQFPISQLGDGLQQAIILTYEAFIKKDKTYAFFVEEPELHMHAGMVRQLMNFYLNETPHYYFFTTHSNHLLDMADESDQVIIQKFIKQSKKDDEKQFEFKIYRCDRDRDLLASLGVRPSSIYLANCTIWVEGITDRLYITKYMEKYLAELENSNEDLYKKYRRFMPNYHYTFVEYAALLHKDLKCKAPLIEPNLRRNLGKWST